MIKTNISLIGDPQIVVHNGTYYCYSTYITPGNEDEGFYTKKSTDLVNWSEWIHCFNPPADHWASKRFWAPEVIYHNGKFVMHYSGYSKEKKELRLGVAVSDSPEGPFVDVYNAPMFELGYPTIDGSVLISDEGNFLYYSRDCSGNIIDGIKTSQLYCVQLDDTLTKTVGEHVLVATPHLPFETKSLNLEIYKNSYPHLWNEGPFVIKLGNKYVMNYSANCYASNDYAICVATADHPMGPWKKSINNPVLSCREDLFGAGHNALFYTNEGELYTSFHIQTNPDKPSGDRTVVFGKVSFTEENGDIKQIIE